MRVPHIETEIASRRIGQGLNGVLACLALRTSDERSAYTQMI